MVVLVLVGLSACRHEARYFKEAETCFQQGVEQRGNKQSEEAAASFSQALLTIEHCDPTLPEVKRLKAQIEDNLKALNNTNFAAEELRQIEALSAPVQLK